MVRVAVAAVVVIASPPTTSLRLSSSPPVSEARRIMEDGRRAIAISSSLMYRMTLARSGWTGPDDRGSSATGGEAV
uniref:Putative secreted protein n=1 Tax=Anopheles marajoara TaxID=58244 RepID=A0A2M4CE09_9DIPT